MEHLLTEALPEEFEQELIWEEKSQNTLSKGH